MRQVLWAALMIAAAGWLAVPASASEPDPQLLAEQNRLESGNDLSSRARRALFRARDRQDEGANEEAATIITNWLAGDPGREHHLLRFNQAASYFSLDRPADALTSLEKAVDLSPRFARAWVRLGEAAYELEEYARAGEAFGQAYDLSPEHQPEILYYAGVSLLSGGQPGLALDQLARLIDHHAEVAGLDWYQALLAAAVDAAQPDRAVSYLDRLLLAEPDNPDAWVLAYRFHAGQTAYEAAAIHLTVADHLRALDRSELVQLGDLYAVIGVPLQAARYYERAYTADSEPKPAEYRKLASAWLAAHELTSARSTLQVALAARPTTVLWALQGDVEYVAQDFRAALTAFSKSTELDPDYGRGYLMMGYCALELGEEESARQHLSRAAEFPDQAAAAQGLGLND